MIYKFKNEPKKAFIGFELLEMAGDGRTGNQEDQKKTIECSEKKKQLFSSIGMAGSFAR